MLTRTGCIKADDIRQLFIITVVAILSRIALTPAFRGTANVVALQSNSAEIVLSKSHGFAQFASILSILQLGGD